MDLWENTGIKMCVIEQTDFGMEEISFVPNFFACFYR